MMLEMKVYFAVEKMLKMGVGSNMASLNHSAWLSIVSWRICLQRLTEL